MSSRRLNGHERASELTVCNRILDKLATRPYSNGRCIRRRREALPADSSLRAACADLGLES